MIFLLAVAVIALVFVIFAVTAEAVYGGRGDDLWPDDDLEDDE